LVLVTGLHATSLIDAFDGALRSAYYRVAPSFDRQSRVVLVEADDATIEAWGAPPWSDQRRIELEQWINAGEPAAVVVLDPSRMFEKTSNEALAPGGPPRADLSIQIDPGTAVVESLDLDDLSLRELQPVLMALGIPPPTQDRLFIHYRWPATQLPAVGFQRIEQGDVPASIFTDKIVVVGLTSHGYRDSVPTPIGSLTSPEIFGHALSMLANDEGWYEPSGLIRGFGLFMVTLAAVFALRRASISAAIVRVVLIAAAVLLADLLLFSQGLVRWGVAAELFALVIVTLGHFGLLLQQSAGLATAVSERISGQLEQGEGALPGLSEEAWQDMAEIARAYLDVPTTGVIAEVPAGGFHIQPRAFIDMGESDIVERRRDVRRPPYRSAFLTHRANRIQRRFVANPEQWTLAVPLTHRARLHGMWMINLPENTELDAAEMELIEDLGAELGRSIADARRGQGHDGAPALVPRSITDRLSTVIHEVEALGEDKRRVVDTFDSLPIGLLVADIWGRVVRVNAELHAMLSTDLPEGIPNDDLRAVISRLTRRTLPEVHEIMRTVIRSGETFRFRAMTDGDRGTSYLLMPMRRRSARPTHHAEDGGRPDEGAIHLVLMAMPDDLDRVVDLVARSA